MFTKKSKEYFIAHGYCKKFKSWCQGFPGTRFYSFQITYMRPETMELMTEIIRPSKSQYSLLSP